MGELRFDTDLDVSHAVARYMELLKLAALIERRAEARSVADALAEINARIAQAVTAEQREIFQTSSLDESCSTPSATTRPRAPRRSPRATEPSLEAVPAEPRRRARAVARPTSTTYRTCPLRYKFARVFRIPQEPTLNQRFGILVHQVLERFHAGDEPQHGRDELLGPARRRLAARRLRRLRGGAPAARQGDATR